MGGHYGIDYNLRPAIYDVLVPPLYVLDHVFNNNMDRVRMGSLGTSGGDDLIAPIHLPLQSPLQMGTPHWIRIWEDLPLLWWVSPTLYMATSGTKLYLAGHQSPPPPLTLVPARWPKTFSVKFCWIIHWKFHRIIIALSVTQKTKHFIESKRVQKFTTNILKKTKYQQPGPTLL